MLVGHRGRHSDGHRHRGPAAGDFVNLHAGGVRKRRQLQRPEANGYVIAAVANAATATVYSDDANTAVAGLTLGTAYYLGRAARSRPPPRRRPAPWCSSWAGPPAPPRSAPRSSRPSSWPSHGHAAAPPERARVQGRSGRSCQADLHRWRRHHHLLPPHPQPGHPGAGLVGGNTATNAIDILIDVVATTDNEVTVTFGTAPPTGSREVTLIG